MRYLFGFMCVVAVGAMGCDNEPDNPLDPEIRGDGGSGGVGDGGNGGDGGTGGAGLCEGVTCEDDGNQCTGDGVCNPADGGCDYPELEDGAECGQGDGACEAGVCVFSCTEQGIRDAIDVGGGPHAFDCNAGQTITTEETILIDNDVVLDGEGVTLDGRNVETVFRVVERASVKLTRFTLIGRGHAALYNIGDLTLANSTVTNGPGWGIDNDGALTVINTTLSGNAGLGVDTPAKIFNEGSLALINSTVVADSVSADALETGPVRVADQDYLTRIGRTLILGRCILRQPLTSDGYNIESPGDTCGFDQNTDRVLTEAQLNLGPLQDNGGPTQTHALEAGSEAINKIPADDCEVDTDQRGEPRPEAGGTMCDVGAFEAPGPVTDCTEGGGACTVGDSPGLCLGDACALLDCWGVTDGTFCVRAIGIPTIAGWCWDGSCDEFVRDCTGLEDLTACNVDPNEGFCIEDACEQAVPEWQCDVAGDGTLCWTFPFGGPGFCLGSSCA